MRLPKGAGGLPRASVAKCAEPYTLWKEQLAEQCGPLPERWLRQLDEALAPSLGLAYDRGEVNENCVPAPSSGSVLRLREVRPDGSTAEPATVAELPADGGSGFPQIVPHDGGMLLAWVEGEGELSRVRAAAIDRGRGSGR